MIFRNFLFLDTDTLNDYLATIEGHIVTGDITQKDVERKGKGGKAGFKVMEGELATEHSTETTQKLAVTDAARFQNLYDLLQRENLIQYLDAFDEGIWKQLKRGELLEIDATIRLPESFKLFQATNEVAPLLDLMAIFGESPINNPQERAMLEAMSKLAALNENKPIPVLFEAISTPEFSFFAKLTKKYLRCDLNDLEGEATVFGKVQRILKKDQQVEVYSILPALTSSLSGLSRDELAKKRHELREKGGIDIIKGPAIVLTPVAIYR